jgi:hypothetical protein
MTGCKDCGPPLAGKFCSECGQKDIALDRPLKALVGDLISQAFNLDGRLLRTVRVFALRPGELTSEVVAGRRVAYTPPLRMYLAVSVLYFLFAAWATAQGMIEPDSELIDRELQEALFREYIPRLMVFLVPMFALLLKALYWRRLYFDHQIHALHLHTAYFLYLIPSTALEGVGRSHPIAASITGGVLFLYMLWYFAASLREVYGTGWVSATLKMLLLFFSYLVLAVTLSVVAVLLWRPELLQ